MYDHQTHSLWSHITDQAVKGAFQGKQLQVLVSMPKIAWRLWKTNYPETKVLSVANNTDSPGQHRENEVQDRYQHYHQSSRAGVSQTQYTESRLKNKEQVVGIRINEDYHAYPFFAFKEKSVINDVVDQTPILVFHHHDSGATAVFLSRLETKQLTFVELSDHLVKDHQSQTVWNLITGTEIEGELKGKNW